MVQNGKWQLAKTITVFEKLEYSKNMKIEGNGRFLRKKVRNDESDEKFLALHKMIWVYAAHLQFEEEGEGK